MPTRTDALAAGELFLAVYHRVHRVAAEQMNAQGTSLPRTKALGLIDSEGPIRPRTMAERFECSPASVTDMVDGLERDGLALRQSDPSDRRASLVTITPSGQSALTSARARRAEVLDAIFGVLGEQEQTVFMRALDTLAASPILNGEQS